MTKIEAEEADGYITFSTDKMGVFVFTGVPGGGETTPGEGDTEASPEQPGENAGATASGIPTAGADTGRDENEIISPGAFVLWLLTALAAGIGAGMGIGYVMWGKYKTKRVKRGPKVIGE